MSYGMFCNRSDNVYKILVITFMSSLCLVQCESIDNGSKFISAALKREMINMRREMNSEFHKLKKEIKTDFSKLIRNLGIKQYIQRLSKSNSIDKIAGKLDQMSDTIESHYNMTESKLSLLHSTMRTMQEQTENVEDQIENVATSATLINKRIYSLENTLNSVNYKYGSLETSLSSVNNKIGSFEIIVSSLNNRFGFLETRITNLRNTIGGLESGISSVNYKFGIQATNFGLINNKIGIVDSTIKLLSKKIEEAITKISSVKTDFSKLFSIVQFIENRYGDFNKANNPIIKMEKYIISLENTAKYIEAGTDTIDSKIDEIKAITMPVKDDIIYMQNNTISINNNIEYITSRVAIMYKTIKSLEENMSYMNNRSESLESIILSVNGTAQIMLEDINLVKNNIQDFGKNKVMQNNNSQCLQVNIVDDRKQFNDTALSFVYNKTINIVNATENNEFYIPLTNLIDKIIIHKINPAQNNGITLNKNNKYDNNNISTIFMNNKPEHLEINNSNISNQNSSTVINDNNIENIFSMILETDNLITSSLLRPIPDEILELNITNILEQDSMTDNGENSIVNILGSNISDNENIENSYLVSMSNEILDRNDTKILNQISSIRGDNVKTKLSNVLEVNELNSDMNLNPMTEMNYSSEVNPNYDLHGVNIYSMNYSSELNPNYDLHGVNIYNNTITSIILLNNTIENMASAFYLVNNSFQNTEIFQRKLFNDSSHILVDEPSNLTNLSSITDDLSSRMNSIMTSTQSIETSRTSNENMLSGNSSNAILNKRPNLLKVPRSGENISSLMKPINNNETEPYSSDVILNALDCSAGFIFSSQCFYVFADQYRSWDEAHEKCLTEGLQLAEPRDPVALRAYIMDNNLAPGWLWLGGRGNGSTFIWTSSRRVIPSDDPSWFPGAPGAHLAPSRCLLLMVGAARAKKHPTTPYVPGSCNKARYILCQQWNHQDAAVQP